MRGKKLLKAYHVSLNFYLHLVRGVRFLVTGSEKFTVL